MLSGSFHRGLAVTHPTSIHEDADSIPGLAQWDELWCRLQMRLRSGVAVAVAAGAALIGPLAWEVAYAAGAALQRRGKK